MTHPLTQDDMFSLGYDLQKVAIFHKEPIHVEIPGLEPFTVGDGYGGFHWTVFARGEDCTACGACCFNCRRRTWWWHADEPNPNDETVQQITGTVNGVEVPFVYHMTSTGERFQTCDYLAPIVDGEGVQTVERNGRPMFGCTLHKAGTKPLHCRMDPFMSVHSVRRGDGRVDLLSRRLPSRNWRWPKCPIVIAEEKLSPEVVEADRKNFMQLFNTWGHLPGSDLGAGIELWELAIDALQSGKTEFAETIFFDEAIGKRSKYVPVGDPVTREPIVLDVS